LTGAQEVEITGGPGPDEYHRVTIFPSPATPTDTIACRRSAAAQLEIHAEKVVSADISGDDDFSSRLSAARQPPGFHAGT
jgi:hypothetical protein